MKYILRLFLIIIAPVLAQDGIATWVLKSEVNQGGSATLTCNNAGSGIYVIDEAYPARCEFQGSKLVVRVWGIEEAINLEPPVIKLNLLIDGNKISGTSELQNGEPYSGYRQGTKNIPNQITKNAQVRNSIKTYERESDKADCQYPPQRATWCAQKCIQKYGVSYPISCTKKCYQDDYNDLLESMGCKRIKYIMPTNEEPSKAIRN